MNINVFTICQGKKRQDFVLHYYYVQFSGNFVSSPKITSILVGRWKYCVKGNIYERIWGSEGYSRNKPAHFSVGIHNAAIFLKNNENNQ